MTIGTKINQFDERGELHGTWEDYFTTGELSCRVNYYHGQRHGLAEDYSCHKTVWVWYKGEWKNDKQTGLWYEKRYD